MKALLIISHGSRKETSNQEVRDLSLKVASQLGESFDVVEAAFLELADPLIPEGIRRCADLGAKEVLIVPYFLAAGRHVIEDIPGIVDAERPLYSDVRISIAPHLGSSDAMAAFVADSALSFKA